MNIVYLAAHGNIENRSHCAKFNGAFTPLICY